MSVDMSEPLGAGVPRSAEAALLQRLELMERDNRRLRRYGIMMLVVIAVILGVIAAMVLFSSRFGPGATAEVVAARQFVLRGRDNTVRGVWGTEPDGTLRFALQDGNGRARAKLTLLTDGSAGFTFADSAGRPRAAFALLPDQTASLVLADHAGNTRSVLGVSAEGNATLVFADRNGVTRAGLGVDSRGSGTFTLVDRGGVELTQPDVEPPPVDTAATEPSPAPSGRRR